MKTNCYILLMLSISLTALPQQPKKTNTVLKAERKFDEALKTQQYYGQLESNALAKESLIKLNDTTISETDREIHIDNYRHASRNGNPNIKKKSYDLTPEENNQEILALSKSSKFNKKAKQTCANMYKRMTKPYDQFADEHFYEFNLLSDSTYKTDDYKIGKLVKSYIAFKVNYNENNYSSIPIEQRKSWLLLISNNQKFSKQIREKGTQLYNETN